MSKERNATKKKIAANINSNSNLQKQNEEESNHSSSEQKPQLHLLEKEKVNNSKKISSQPEFEVEEVLDKRKKKNSVDYKVKWVGYPMAKSTWEPLKNLSNCMQLVNDFEKQKVNPESFTGKKRSLIEKLNENNSQTEELKPVPKSKTKVKPRKASFNKSLIKKLGKNSKVSKTTEKKMKKKEESEEIEESDESEEQTQEQTAEEREKDQRGSNKSSPSCLTENEENHKEANAQSDVDTANISTKSKKETRKSCINYIGSLPLDIISVKTKNRKFDSSTKLEIVWKKLENSEISTSDINALKLTRMFPDFMFNFFTKEMKKLNY